MTVSQTVRFTLNNFVLCNLVSIFLVATQPPLSAEDQKANLDVKAIIML